MLKWLLVALSVFQAHPHAFAQPLQAGDIVILGEVHDNADAHEGQAQALRSLAPTAVVFEMLSPEDARRADTERDMIPEIWAEGNWPDYTLYAPIFEALGSARIIGAASPRAMLSSVFREGPGAYFGSDADRFGLSTPLPLEQQAAREALQFKAHCEAMPGEMMGGMVNVQRFRDAVFARAALEALETYGPPVAVIVGNGHARTDWGIPAAIANASPDVVARTIAFVEGQPDAPYDEVHLVPPAKRDDPCNRFR